MDIKIGDIFINSENYQIKIMNVTKTDISTLETSAFIQERSFNYTLNNFFDLIKRHNYRKFSKLEKTLWNLKNEIKS